MPTPIPDRLGTELAGGRYRISSRIGEGSMGQVYRAHDRRLRTEVVVKFPVVPEGAGDPGSFLDRFARESRAMIRLSHPHVVQVIDVGEDAGLPFVVMAYLDGGSLKDRIMPSKGGEPRPMPPESLHGWLMDVAKALDFIHAEGHIHRDVKPANILFDRHGNAFLADFGVIKPLGAEVEVWTGRSSLTAPGYLLGTPNYLAPELVMGEPSDGRVDQYALALTVHEALAGWNCMEGPTPSATLVNQTKFDPPILGALLRDVPQRLSEAVLKALSKEPGDRFASCSALAREILAEVPPLVPGQTLSAPSLVTPPTRGESGRVPCPACGGLLPVVADHAGRRVVCTRCRATAVVQVSGDSVQLLLIAPPPGTNPSWKPAPRPEARASSRVKASARARIGWKGWLGVALIGLASLGWLGSRFSRGRAIAPGVGREGSPIELNVVYAAEKRTWIEYAARTFAQTPEGRGVAIHLIARGSIQGLEDVIDGMGPGPVHVWSPASSAYRAVFERDWKARHPGSRSPILEGPSLVRTPLVFVFWNERQEAFLRKYGSINFRTLGQAMHEPGGWSSIAGRPEWGLFRFAHARPSRSSSGLMPLYLMACEFSGKARGLSLADITRGDFPVQLARFERGLARHSGSLADSSSDLMGEFLQGGPARYDGIIVSENLAIENQDLARERWGGLRVSYPVPTIWDDHPYYILDGPGSDPRHRDAAASFLRFLLSEPAQREARKLGFRPLDGVLPGPMVLGIKPEVPQVAEPPSAEVIDDLISAFRRLEP